jgi:small subunit ribosomal protein S30e
MPTHGSLTKAGKVRNQTPKLSSANKKKPSPGKRNWKNYKKRILLAKNDDRSYRRRRR